MCVRMSARSMYEGWWCLLDESIHLQNMFQCLSCSEDEESLTLADINLAVSVLKPCCSKADWTAAILPDPTGPVPNGTEDMLMAVPGDTDTAVSWCSSILGTRVSCKMLGCYGRAGLWEATRMNIVPFECYILSSTLGTVVRGGNTWANWKLSQSCDRASTPRALSFG